MNFKKYVLTVICFLCLAQMAAAVELDSKNRDPKYVSTIVERSKKIVDKLGLKEADAATQVTNIIANRYFLLNDIYAKRDTSINKAKRANLAKDELSRVQTLAKAETDAALYRNHFAFAADLSLFLNETQIEAVKDGMTFGVVNVTYVATLEMIPSLKEEEKVQIMAWLKEARELAIDAETANKKHEAFGKYKGRINNYLAKRGYDLVKEREGWYARIKAKEAEQKK